MTTFMRRAPSRAHEAALGDDLAQSQHRRVRGQDDELSARLGQRQAAVESAREVCLQLHRFGREAAVLGTQSELGGPITGRDQPLQAVEERLEVHVPDPGHVAAVGDRIVQGDDGQTRRAAGDQRPDRLIGSGRVLDQKHEEPLVTDLDALEAAESGAEALEARLDLVRCRAERGRKGGSRDRVVDVVEAW